MNIYSLIVILERMQIKPTLSQNLVSQMKDKVFRGSIPCLCNTWTKKYVYVNIPSFS